MRHTWTVNDFPIGFEQIHPEQSINFQLNRLYHFSGDPVLLAQLRKAAPGIRDLTSLVAGLIPLAERAEEDGELLRAAGSANSPTPGTASGQKPGTWFRSAASSFPPSDSPPREGAGVPSC